MYHQCGSDGGLCLLQSVRVELQSQVAGLQEHVQELERKQEERRGEREREKREAETTILSLTTELETLRKQFDDQQRMEGERVSKVVWRSGSMGVVYGLWCVVGE